MKILVTTIAIALAFSSCSFLTWKSSGNVEVANLKSKQKARVSLGMIQTRDSRSDPYSARNLQDMLAFEMANRGYLATRARHPAKTEQTPGPASTPPAKPDETTDLFPEKMRNLAGETRPQNGYGRADDLLDPTEIRQVMNQDGSNYFLQGAISRTESGNLLEMEENFMIFLEVYNQTGERTGMITFTVGGNSLQSAPFLKAVCARIAKAFDDQVASTK
ncbi:MAG: lipoprotein [Leptospirales bacterium]|nr:lipoprotein [Leptospirales bacterium]